MFLTLRIYFRKIQVANTHLLLKNQPAILVANHPASFLDAMVLAVFIGRPLYFYVRGDIFKHPLAYRILTFLHMIPIFSLEHGVANMGKNQATFVRGRLVLKKGGLLLVFPEGVSRLSKKLFPLKKGASRVALQTAFENDQQFPLVFQTVAINYSKHSLGADLLIRVGEQLALSDYSLLYAENKNKAILQVTQDLQRVFERNVIHVEHDERTAHVEDLIQLDYSSSITPNERFDRARWLCSKTDQLEPDEFNVHVGMMAKYKFILRQNKTIDACMASRDPALLIFFETIMLFPIFLVGAAIWIIPVQLTKWVADKKVTRIDFYTSVFSAILAVSGLIWWIILLVSGFTLSNYYITAILIFSPAWAYGSMRWLDKWKLMKSYWNFNELEMLRPHLVEELKGIRRKLLFQ